MNKTIIIMLMILCPSAAIARKKSLKNIIYYQKFSIHETECKSKFDVNPDIYNCLIVVYKGKKPTEIMCEAVKVWKSARPKRDKFSCKTHDMKSSRYNCKGINNLSIIGGYWFVDYNRHIQCRGGGSDKWEE